MIEFEALIVIHMQRGQLLRDAYNKQVLIIHVNDLMILFTIRNCRPFSSVDG